jgi:flagellar FliL protein
VTAKEIVWDMKKNTLNIIILTLCLINLVLNVLIIFSVIPTANKANNLITKIAGIIDLELKPEYNVQTGSLSIDQIDARTITTADSSTSKTIQLLSSDGKKHYAVVTTVVSLDTTNADYAKLSASFDNAMQKINSVIDDVVSQYDDTNAVQSKSAMCDEILQQLRDLFQSDMIYEVSFSSFVIQ